MVLGPDTRQSITELVEDPVERDLSADGLHLLQTLQTLRTLRSVSYLCLFRVFIVVPVLVVLIVLVAIVLGVLFWWKRRQNTKQDDKGKIDEEATLNLLGRRRFTFHLSVFLRFKKFALFKFSFLVKNFIYYAVR